MCPLWCLGVRVESLTRTQLQEAVTTAHETSTAFSDEVIKEHDIFELSKQQEMKEMLQAHADGQVEMFQRVSLGYPLLFSRPLARRCMC